jgi:hypothetical protein
MQILAEKRLTVDRGSTTSYYRIASHGFCLLAGNEGNGKGPALMLQLLEHNRETKAMIRAILKA